MTTVYEPSSEGGYVVGRISIRGTGHLLRYRATGEPLTATVEPFVAASLFPSMAAGEAIRVEPPMSPRLLGSIPKIQRLVAGWGVGLRPIPVDARPGEVSAPSNSRVGCLFSGGVDSYYTALKHLEGITDLIFVHGLDIPLDREARRREVAEGVRRGAAELGKPLIEVETDARPFITRFVPWRFGHGGAIAGVALVLSDRLGTVLIPASHSYAEGPPPYGSHPLLDPFWSTERVDLVYDGFEATRLEKLRAIASNEGALRWLRVCHDRSRDGSYNCGRCDKCLRTMGYLRALGVLDRCDAFPPLDLAAMAAVRIDTPDLLALWEDDLRMLRASGDDPALTAAVAAVVARGRRNRRVHHRIRRRLRHTLRRERG